MITSFNMTNIISISSKYICTYEGDTGGTRIVWIQTFWFYFSTVISLILNPNSVICWIQMSQS